MLVVSKIYMEQNVLAHIKEYLTIFKCIKFDYFLTDKKIILHFTLFILLAKKLMPSPYLSHNPRMDKKGHKLYQGDMILNKKQNQSFTNPIQMRKALDDEKFWWPNALVPYLISESSERDSSAIKKAISQWEQNSCIRFEEVEVNYSKPHIIFTKDEGCFSYVGYQEELPDGQALSIDHGCEDVAIIIHEIGHALGFHHEQARPDRDDYIMILINNVEEDERHNFDKEIINDFNISYDFDSIMHYGPTEFSSNGRFTIVTKNPFYQFRLGQLDGLSFGDIKLINLMYNCSVNCSSPPDCMNDGFVDKSCQCVCPSGLSGPTCQEGNPTVNLRLTCGRTINETMTIHSPEYPNNYPKDTKCVWVVTAATRKKIRIRFYTFHLSRRSNTKECINDQLELRISDLSQGESFCGEELKRKEITCDANKIIIVFFTTQSFPGFEANIDFI